MAQATGVSNSTNSAPVRIYKLTKPLTDQAVVVNLGYDQKAKVDFSSIANEKITLVHIGEKLIILFDNQSTVTVEPFFDSRADGQNNITIEMAPGRDVSVQEFASLFPISTDGSVLPAADNGGNSNGNAQASGAYFSPFAVDPLDPVPTNQLAPPEDLPGFTTTQPTGTNLPQTTTALAPTISGGLVPSLIVDESFLTAATNLGVAGSGLGPAGTTVATVQVTFNINAPGGQQSLTYALSIASPNEDSGLIDSATGQHVLLTVNAAGVVEGRTAIGGDLVFTIAVDATGHVTLTDLRAVHEGTAGDFNEGISLAFGLVTLTATVTDNIGQTASASVDIGSQLTILDDGPVNNATTAAIAVAEDTLPGGNLDPGSPLTTTATFSGATIASLVNSGADAPITISFNTAINGVDTGLTQTAVFGGTAFKIVWSYVSATEIDGIVSGGPNNGDKVFTLVKTAGGDFAFTLLEHVDNGIGETNTTTLNLNNVFTATDADGDSVVIDNGATVTIQNDAPTQNAATVAIAVAEDTLPGGNPDKGSTLTTEASFTGAQIQGLVSAGADTPVLIGFNGAIAGTNTGLTQTAVFGGTAYNIVWAANGAHEMDGVVSGGPNNGQLVFKLVQSAGGDGTFGTADDTFTFTLLEHVDNGTGETNTTTLNLNNVFKATDTDGDVIVIDNGAAVTIQNDVPLYNPAAKPVDYVVGEDHLANGNSATDNPAAPPTTATITVADLQSLVLGGADSPTLVFAFNSAAAIDGTSTGLTQTLQFGGVAEAINWKYIDATHLEGVVAGGPKAGDVVFTLTDNGNGTFTFTLLEHIDNGGSDTSSKDLSLANVFVATDTDGDQVALGGNIAVTIQNDVPLYNPAAKPVDYVVGEDHLANGNSATDNPAAPPTTATITVADLQSLVLGGADSPTLVFAFNSAAAIDGTSTGLTQTLQFGGVAEAINWKYIDATHLEGVVAAGPKAGDVVFTLTDNGNGTFTFTLLEHIDNGGSDTSSKDLSLANVFVATDTDGDQVALGGNIAVTIQNDVPLYNPAAKPVDYVVGEDHLANGNSATDNPAAPPTTATITVADLQSLVLGGADSPTLVFAFNSAAAIDGTSTGLTQTLQFGGVAEAINWKYIDATHLEGVVAGGPKAGDVVFTLTDNGNGTFTFTLLEHIDNGGSDTSSKDLSLANVFVATDTDGDQVALGGNIAVTIQNDVPTQNANTVTAAVAEDMLPGGNLDAGSPLTTTASFTGAQIQGLVNAGADAPVVIGFNGAIAGTNTGLTQTAVFGGTAYDIVWKANGVHEMDGVVSGGPNNGQVVFKLVQTAGGDGTFGTSDDAFTFTLINHVDNGTGETKTATLSLASVFTATDTDGDKVVIDAGASVTIQNDAPTQNGCCVTIAVAEDALPGGNQDVGSPLTTTASFTGAEIQGLVSAGADAPVVIGFNGAIAGTNTGLTQTAVFGGTAYNIKWAANGAHEMDGVVSGGPNNGQVVFKLVQTAGGDGTFGTSDDAFTFTLVNHVDNGTGDANTTTLNLNNVFTATDTDGDKVVIDDGASVTIQNDAPKQNAVTVTIAVAEDMLPGGNLDAGSPLTTTASFTGAQIQGLVSAGADAPVVIGFNGTIAGTNTGLTQTAVFGGTAYDIVWKANGAHEMDGVVSGGPNNGQVVFKLVQTAGGDGTFGTSDDAFTFTLVNHVDNGTGDANTTTLNLNSVFTATDTDGDKVVIDDGASVTIQNDAPTQNAATVTVGVAEDMLPGGNLDAGSPLTTTASFTGAQIQGLVNAGADVPVVIGFNGTIAGTNTGLTQTAVFGGTAYDIVWKANGAHEMDGVVSGGPNNGQVVFKLVQTAGGDGTFGTSDDAFTFTLVNHVDNGTGDANTTTLNLNSVFTATDTDGDKVVIDNGASVTIENDAPVATSTVLSGTVDEDSLPGALAPGEVAAAPATASGNVSALFLAGADAPLHYSFSADISSLTAQDLKSGGVALTYTVTVASGIETLTATAGATTVFTLTLNETTGAYTFTLASHLDHAPPPAGTAVENTLAINFGAVIQATDTDGDTVTASAASSIAVTVIDDVPQFGTIEHGIMPDQGGLSVLGNIAVYSGADGFGEYVFSLAGNTAPAGLMFDGQAVHYAIDAFGLNLTAYIGAAPSAANDIFTLNLDPSTDQYLFTLLQPFTTTTVENVGGATSFGTGPSTEYVLASGAHQLAVISGTASDGSQGEVNGSTPGWGVGNNGFNVNEKLLFDFTDTASASPQGNASFHPPGPESVANYTFSNYKGGDDIHYVVSYWDGVNTASIVSVSGDFDPSTHASVAHEWSTPAAPAGLQLYTVQFTDVTGSGKVDLVSVGVESTTNLSENLSFNVSTIDSDGDMAHSTINIDINGSTTLMGTAGNDVLIAGKTSATLTGNGGDDKFVLNYSHDIITDFNSGDLLLLDVAGLNLPLGASNTVTAAQFTSSAATNGTENSASAWNESGSTNKFFFNNNTHELWYSANGTGSDKVDLAHLSTGVPAAANIHIF
ncbi:T1SS-143 repeat domain-containing protein [Bradyrhizobium sp. USDA 3364]